ncbi:MAG TPA: hypothetical protein VK421_00045 [Pyrinomonadaceae bacterium]|nr:hypothetical protein [Pyrinomonadaceae bacterium]
MGTKKGGTPAVVEGVKVEAGAARGLRSARRHVLRLAALAVVAASILSGALRVAARAASGEAEVRGAVEGAFRQLRAGQYGPLYDALPSSSRRRLSRQQFVSSLERARGMYELDRLEIGSVRVAGDLAVVDATIYAWARVPFEAEGKIVARQYLVREGGRWRVTTGEASTVRPLLAAHPDFAKKFPPREPRIFLKRDGRWVEMGRTARGHR